MKQSVRVQIEEDPREDDSGVRKVRRINLWANMGFHQEYIRDTTKAMNNLRSVERVTSTDREIAIHPKDGAKNFEADVLAATARIYRIIQTERI